VAQYNEKKLRVLAVFERGGPLTPVEVAVRARAFPADAMYSYLRRLARWGLVTRGRRWRRGRMLYWLTEKGKRRLQWLRGSPRLRELEQATSRAQTA
jgi:DNA-binding IclR family transcriptional regulator